MHRSSNIPTLIGQWAWRLLPIALVGLALPLRVGEVALAVVATGLTVALRVRSYALAGQLLGSYTLFLLIFATLGRRGLSLPPLGGISGVLSYHYCIALVVLFSVAVSLPWFTKVVPQFKFKNHLIYYSVGGFLWVLLLILSLCLPHDVERAPGVIWFWFLVGLWVLGAIDFRHIFGQPRFLKVLALGVLGLSCWTAVYLIAGHHYSQLAIKFEKHGSHQRAIECYRLASLCLEWTGLNTASARAAALRGELLQRHGDQEEALQVLTHAHRLQPRLAEPVVIRAELLIQQGKLGEAWMALSNLGPQVTLTGENRRRLLFIYLRLKAYEEAANLIALTPDLLKEIRFAGIQPESLEALGDALWALDNKELGLRLFQDLTNQPDQAPRIYGKVGQLQFEMGMLEACRKSFKHLHKISPSSPTASYFLGLLSEKERRYEEALSHYLKALQANPDQGPSLERAIELLNRWPDKSALQSRLKRHLQSLTPEHSVEAIWDNWLLFSGYDLDSTEYKRGEEFTVTHYWRILRPQRTPPIWFLHLDKPYESWHPPSKYRIADEICRHYGTIFEVTHRVLIPESISPGLYRLVLGAYRPRYGDYYNLKPVVLKNAALHQLPENAIHLSKLRIG